MGSLKQSKQPFNSQDVLDLALAGALATVKELGIKRQGLEGILRGRLVAIASEGITDPAVLRDKALKSLNVDKIAT